jgi:phospholipase C
MTLFSAIFTDFLDAGSLPPVSWVKFYGRENEHPGYADLVDGNVHLANIVNRIKASKLWDNSLIIVTHDEFGGRFDHVPPPIVDEFGPGMCLFILFYPSFVRLFLSFLYSSDLMK